MSLKYLDFLAPRNPARPIAQIARIFMLPPGDIIMIIVDMVFWGTIWFHKLMYPAPQNIITQATYGML